MTNAGSSRDRIIIRDQIQRRPNLDEVEDHRPGLVDPEHHVLLRYMYTNTKDVSCSSCCGKLRVDGVFGGGRRNRSRERSGGPWKNDRVETRQRGKKVEMKEEKRDKKR